jgi:hypothetical protein
MLAPSLLCHPETRPVPCPSASFRAQPLFRRSEEPGVDHICSMWGPVVSVTNEHRQGRAYGRGGGAPRKIPIRLPLASARGSLRAGPRPAGENAGLRDDAAFFDSQCLVTRCHSFRIRHPRPVSCPSASFRAKPLFRRSEESGAGLIWGMRDLALPVADGQSGRRDGARTEGSCAARQIPRPAGKSAGLRDDAAWKDRNSRCGRNLGYPMSRWFCETCEGLPFSNC